MTETVSITITQKENYQFLVDFGDAIPNLLVDEPVPMGAGSGPAPAHILLTAAANCLSASLLFSLKKYGQDAGGITTRATCTIDRNPNNRLRVLHIDVMIQFAQDGANIKHLDRVLGQFEEFCTVSQSIQAGIPIKVSVTDGRGVCLK
ncbi:MAG: OsmC family protein [Glaciimonas sp.]|nr:OsmC family protein [Glaciimonas sp.]